MNSTTSMYAEVSPLQGSDDRLCRVFLYGAGNRTVWIQFRDRGGPGLEVWDYTPGAFADSSSELIGECRAFARRELSRR